MQRRQLISQDIHLLKEIAELGDVSPRVFDQNHRLERLELEGYVSSVRHDPLGLDAAPAWVYRLTLKGPGYCIQTVNLIHRDG